MGQAAARAGLQPDGCSNEGEPVRAWIRDPGHPQAAELRRLGAEIAEGDLNLPASMRSAMEGVYGVFSVQALHLDDLEREFRHGYTIAEAAKAAGVLHFVYSSAAGANRATGITAFENKGRLERAIQALSLPATILRPAMFMDNFLPFLRSSDTDRPVILPYMGPPDTQVQLISVQDIGAAAALAFEEPRLYIGEAAELAGDELSLEQLRQTLQTALGVPIAFAAPSAAAGAAEEHDGVKAAAFFHREGFRADLASLRARLPGLLRFEDWLRHNAAG
ncbi:NmrA/HSCARG family protein [Paenibacillus sp. TAB 01]|uniref:NmrA/HSCARG family protein n=1 Tax=Paenibacillus sp. TAB 01 TaxID=3368988 RepID=UPI00375121D5